MEPYRTETEEADPPICNPADSPGKCPAKIRKAFRLVRNGRIG